MEPLRRPGVERRGAVRFPALSAAPPVTGLRPMRSRQDRDMQGAEAAQFQLAIVQKGGSDFIRMVAM
jgi:hypothetical protein